MSSRREYGWVPDVPSFQDRLYAPPPRQTTLPVAVDLRGPFMPPVYDQGQLGSCTANAIAGAHEFGQAKQPGGETFTPSRLFIYYGERVIERTVKQDSGASIRDGMTVIAKQGACPETQWPYIISKFTAKPSPACYGEALKHQALQYQRLNSSDVNELKACLADGFPFVFGFTVFESFESAAVAKTGIVPMPKFREKRLGGHAVLCVGYDSATGRFIVRNSWGVKWGDKGFCYMPIAYLTSLVYADDFWTVRLVEE